MTRAPKLWLLVAAGLVLFQPARAAIDTAPASVHPAGVRVCVTCHPAEAKPYADASMNHALEDGSHATVLENHPDMSLALNGFTYRVEHGGSQSFYSVTDGHETLKLPIHWAFGLGAAGQTYVLEKDGIFYESMVSYYKQPDALEVTLGDQSLRPANLVDAIGRPLGEREKLACFGCHSTASVADHKLTLETMQGGVQCERCHGDTANHLAAFKTGDMRNASMKKLGTLSTEETSTFCGQCHRTWEQISMNGPRGILNVRFQPYRLANSRCYDIDDKRISCVACHNPHQEVDRVSSRYDAKCLACHSGGGKVGAASCKVGTSNCASCHMPKIEIPGSHHQFADHDIRIVKNSAYPE